MHNAMSAPASEGHLFRRKLTFRFVDTRKRESSEYSCRFYFSRYLLPGKTWALRLADVIAKTRRKIAICVGSLRNSAAKRRNTSESRSVYQRRRCLQLTRASSLFRVQRQQQIGGTYAEVRRRDPAFWYLWTKGLENCGLACPSRSAVCRHRRPKSGTVLPSHRRVCKRGSVSSPARNF
jgi:hypothetical protein